MVLRIQSEVVGGVAGEPIRVVPTGAALGANRRDAFDPHSRRIMHRTQVKGKGRPL